jgi:exodeoxyribonuclease VII large subunit
MIDSPTYSVVELARRIGRALEAAFPDDVWVTGEISNLNRSRGGHVYFDLVEPAPEQGQPPVAAIAVALFKMNKDVVNRLLKRAGIARIENGMQVRLRGVVSYYERNGRLQVRMTSIDPTYTLGQLAADRDRVLRLLTAEGLVDANSRLRLAPVPLEVGLVTSAGSAAYHDFVTELERSGFAWHVHLVDTRVQGAGADLHLDAAIRALASREVALIALVRGGGSRTDLAAFDSERVARTIASLAVPVFTGVGHEVDRSVADDVAHTAYKTPTACAAGLVARVQAFLDQTDRAWEGIAARSRRALDLHDRHVRAVAEHCLRATKGALAVHTVRTDHLTARVQREAGQAIARSAARLAVHQGRLVADANRHVRGADADVAEHATALRLRGPRAASVATRHLDAVAAQVRAHDPARALARGWSITRTRDGAVVRSLDAVGPGDELVTTVLDGQVHSTVRTAVPNAHPPIDQD